MLTCPTPTELKQSNEKKEDNNTQTSQSPDSKMDTEQSIPSTSDIKKERVIVSGLNSEQISNIIR